MLSERDSKVFWYQSSGGVGVFAMTPQQKLAHEKMSLTLPSKIHISYDESEKKEDRRPCARFATSKKPVVIGGRRYGSISSAARSLGKKRQQIALLILRGDGRYA